MDPMGLILLTFSFPGQSDPVHDRSTVELLDVSKIVEFSHVGGEWNTWNTFF